MLNFKSSPEGTPVESDEWVNEEDRRERDTTPIPRQPRETESEKKEKDSDKK